MTCDGTPSASAGREAEVSNPICTPAQLLEPAYRNRVAFIRAEIYQGLMPCQQQSA